MIAKEFSDNEDLLKGYALKFINNYRCVKAVGNFEVAEKDETKEADAAADFASSSILAFASVLLVNLF